MGYREKSKSMDPSQVTTDGVKEARWLDVKDSAAGTFWRSSSKMVFCSSLFPRLSEAQRLEDNVDSRAGIADKDIGGGSSHQLQERPRLKSLLTFGHLNGTFTC